MNHNFKKKRRKRKGKSSSGHQNPRKTPDPADNWTLHCGALWSSLEGDKQVFNLLRVWRPIKAATGEVRWGWGDWQTGRAEDVLAPAFEKALGAPKAHPQLRTPSTGSGFWLAHLPCPPRDRVFGGCQVCLKVPPLQKEGVSTGSHNPCHLSSLGPGRFLLAPSSLATPLPLTSQQK